MYSVKWEHTYKLDDSSLNINEANPETNLRLIVQKIDISHTNVFEHIMLK